MQSIHHVSLLFTALVLLIPRVANAEDSSEGVSEGLERGYAYTIEDDPLGATPFGDRGARLTVRPASKRTLLIRPRTHFIVELFKSAEDL
jgi:hypothetical protein